MCRRVRRAGKRREPGRFRGRFRAAFAELERLRHASAARALGRAAERVRRRRTIEVLDVGAGPGGAEGVGEVPVREGAGEVEGRVPAEVLVVHVGAAAQQQLHDGRLRALRGGAAAAAGSVDAARIGVQNDGAWAGAARRAHLHGEDEEGVSVLVRPVLLQRRVVDVLEGGGDEGLVAQHHCVQQLAAMLRQTKIKTLQLFDRCVQ